MAVSKGDKVKIEYEGKLDNGEIFDKSKEPLEFELGSKQVIAGFEKAVLGMEIGQEKEFTLQPKEAYGDHNPQMIKTVPKETLPKEQEPKKGMALMVGLPTGQQIPALITDVTDKQVTIDLNHPLAGKALHFKIKVVA